MTTPAHIAKNLRDVYLSGSWTVTNFKEILADVSWQQATQQVHDFNTIATLLYHTYYFIPVVTRVLQGGPLQGKDAESFDHPPIQSQTDWLRLQQQVYDDVEVLAQLIEKLPEEMLHRPFANGKYGSYYRNLVGVIEHCNYHLGQIALIKKLVQPKDA